MTHTARILTLLTLCPVSGVRAQGEEVPAPPAFEGGVPMTAERAGDLAAVASPRVARARAAVALAEVGVRLGWSGFAPHVELTARYDRVGGFEDGTVQVLEEPGFDPAEAQRLAASVEDPAARELLEGLLSQQEQLGEVEFIIPRDQMGLRARVVLPLSEWFTQVLPSLRASRARLRAEEESARAVRADLVLAGREAFYRYVQARGALSVARAGERQAAEHLDRVEAMERAGLATGGDRMEAAAHLAAERTAVARAEGGVEIATAALESLLRIDAPEGFAVQDPFDATVPPAPLARETLVQRARAARPEMRALRAMDEALAARTVATRGGMYPRLALSGTFDYAQPNPNVVPPQDRLDPSWRLGASLTWSPDEAWRAGLRAEEAQAERALTAADREQLRDRVRAEVIEAHAGYRSARAAITAAADAVRAAEEEYRARLAELRAGRAVSTEVLEADAGLSRARRALLDSVTEAKVARARLAHATGAFAR